jgi:hypothetical protein
MSASWWGEPSPASRMDGEGNGAPGTARPTNLGNKG